MKISYLITVKNELQEIKSLISFIKEHKKITDEIVILMDIPHDNEVEMFLITQDIKLYEHPLNSNFAEFKNYGTSCCKNDYIFNIDADEIIPEYLLQNIHSIIEQNDVELIWVPRINIVEGLTSEWIQKWGWRINEQGWINFPDYQPRIYKNDYPRIHWENKVHERIVGYERYAMLPDNIEYVDFVALKHIKTLSRQIEQNRYYEKIIKENYT